MGNASSSGDLTSNTATWIATVDKKWDVNNGSLLGDATRGMFTSSTTSGIIAKDGTNTKNGPSGTPIGSKKLSIRYNLTTLEAGSDGIWSTTGSYLGHMGLGTYIEIAKGTPCSIRDLAIWNQIALTNAEVLEVIT